MRILVKRRKVDFEEPVNDGNETPIELINMTGTHLQYLNEYCLLDIFSVKTLDLMDLCSIAETSKRFKEIVRRIIPKELLLNTENIRHYEVNLGKYQLRSQYSDEGRKDLKRIFKCFGSLLLKLSVKTAGICHDAFNTEFLLLQLITKHCVDNLKSLNLSSKNTNLGMKIPHFLAAELKPIFEQLQIIELEIVFVDGDKTQFANFNSLVDLRLFNVRNCYLFLENTFPKLSTFTYVNYQHVPQILSTFILRNPTLRLLLLSIHGYDDTCEITIPRAIANSCTDLEELRIGLSSVSANSKIYLQPLQELKSLKVLCIASRVFEDLQLFAPMTQLRELSLRHCTLPKDSSQFESLTHIRHLRVSGYDDNGVIDIISRLIHLERILIHWNHTYGSRFELDEKTFAKIVRIVKRRSNVLELVCKINFNAKNCDRNQMVKLIKPFD